MRLVLAIPPGSLEFTEPNTGGAYPLLASVGTLRVAARAGDAIGIAASASSNISVTLNNAGHKAALLIGAPLRVGATVFEDNGDVFFDGIVAVVEYGGTIVLEIDA